ncbi:MAG TPA: hypothetical protein VGI81_20345 [Tepidisphaeraceae bacterium]|jgi:hypothetical protein
MTDRRNISVLVLLLIIAAFTAMPSRADGQQDRTNAAYARLHAKQIAASQPAAITNVELQELESELTALRAENAKLRAELAKANNPVQQPGAPVAKKEHGIKLPVVPPHQVQIGALEMPVGSPLDFTLDMGVGSVGWVTDPRVVQVIDANSAIIEVFQSTANGQRFVDRQRQVLMRGISTVGMADDTRLATDKWPARYFQVTGTDKVGGTTYFVVEPVKQ